MSVFGLEMAVDAAAKASYEDADHGFIPGDVPWESLPEVARFNCREEFVVAVEASAVVIEADLRATIAAEFDTLAAKLTTSIARMEPGSDSDVILRDRRAQMATAAQMVRGGVTS